GREAGELGGLGLVRREEVDLRQEGVGQRARGGGVEDERGAVHVRQLGCPRDGLERDFQLGQDDGGPGEERLVRVEIGRRQAHVAAGGDDDGVLAAGVHGDDGDAGGG